MQARARFHRNAASQRINQRRQVAHLNRESIPASLLSKVNEQIIIQENEHDVDAMLENLKSYVELAGARVP